MLCWSLSAVLSSVFNTSCMLANTWHKPHRNNVSATQCFFVCVFVCNVKSTTVCFRLKCCLITLKMVRAINNNAVITTVQCNHLYTCNSGKYVFCFWTQTHPLTPTQTRPLPPTANHSHPHPPTHTHLLSTPLYPPTRPLPPAATYTRPLPPSLTHDLPLPPSLTHALPLPPKPTALCPLPLTSSNISQALYGGPRSATNVLKHMESSTFSVKSSSTSPRWPRKFAWNTQTCHMTLVAT